MTQSALVIKLSDDALGRIAQVASEQAAAIVLERMSEAGSRNVTSTYLTVAEAAEYLRCKPQRVYDLLSARTLSKNKDGSRTLLLRAEVEERVAQSAVPRREPLSERR